MKNIILLIGLLMLTNCSNSEDLEKETPYYKFSEEDLDKLLPYEVNQIITYKNENNEERSYIVTSIEIEKEDYGCCGSFGPPTSYTVLYYYDTKKITLKNFPNGGGDWYYFFRRKPPLNSGHGPDVITQFYGGIDDFPFWNGQLSSEDYSVINYHETSILMEINGHEFFNVHIINSDNPDINNSNVNVIYVDEVEGIIGFDDLENKKWRIVI